MNMEQIKQAISNMITISEEEMKLFLSKLYIKKYKNKEYLLKISNSVDKVFFINKGILRVIITDRENVDHTVHFSLENQFISDYSAFLTKTPAVHAIQALENTEVVILPREATEWGYDNLKEGNKLGRLIAEYYFLYFDNRIANTYLRSPKERYDIMSKIFPNIHNRVPQNQIASYLGISPVHLSRLKKASLKKI